MHINELLQAYQTGTISTFDTLYELSLQVKEPLSEGQKGLWALYKIDRFCNLICVTGHSPIYQRRTHYGQRSQHCEHRAGPAAG